MVFKRICATVEHVRKLTPVPVILRILSSFRHVTDLGRTKAVVIVVLAERQSPKCDLMDKLFCFRLKAEWPKYNSSTGLARFEQLTQCE